MRLFKKKTEGSLSEVKRSLLQAYFTSLICMVMCVSMFFSTTYAWFTSEVTNSANEIYIGTLEVGLYKDVQAEGGATARLDLSNEGSKLFDSGIRWEPGYTALETIHVVNRGNLALRFSLSFTDGLLDDRTNPALMEVARYFDVWTYHNDAGDVPAPESIAEIENENSGWVSVGSLDALLSGRAVLSGEILEAAQNEGAQAKDYTSTHTIAVRMRRDADISVTGKKITLNVKLVAYQAVKELDDFGSAYDVMASTPEELQEAFQNGGTVALASDLNVFDVTTLAEVPAGKEIELYLNGHSINARLADPTDSSTQLFSVKKGAKLTIHGDDTAQINVTAGKSDTRVSAVINNEAGTVVINGGKFTMEYGTYSQGYLLPVLVDNNSTSGETKMIINGGDFTHTRNMFRAFANHKTEVVSMEICGGTFRGAAGDAGTIWLQKASAKVPATAGLLTIRGGNFQNMTVCTGFSDENGAAGVTVGEGVTLGAWKADGSEWIATVSAEG